MVSEILGTIIEEGLQYVTNIYAVIAFLCLICLYLIAHYHIVTPPNWFRFLFRKSRISALWEGQLGQLIVTILILVLIIMVGLLLRDVRYKAMYEVEMNIVKGEPRARLHKRVEVKLVDIATLTDIIAPGKPGIEYNLDLSIDPNNVEYIHKRVFEKAGLTNVDGAVKEIWNMSQKQWEDFLNSQDELKRRKILDIPFVKFRIYIDGEKDLGFEDRYHFKRDVVEVEKAGDAALIVKFRLKHVYDTRQDTSDEPETVVVQMVR